VHPELRGVSGDARVEVGPTAGAGQEHDEALRSVRGRWRDDETRASR
jgi:hypothetical protein